MIFQNKGAVSKIPFRGFLLSWKGPSPIRIRCLEVIDKTCPALFSFFFNPWRISSGDKNLKIKLTLDFCCCTTIVGTFVHRFPLFFWVDKCYTMCGWYNYLRATAVTNFFTFLNGKWLSFFKVRALVLPQRLIIIEWCTEEKSRPLPNHLVQMYWTLFCNCIANMEEVVIISNETFTYVLLRSMTRAKSLFTRHMQFPVLSPY